MVHPVLGVVVVIELRKRVRGNVVRSRLTKVSTGAMEGVMPWIYVVMAGVFVLGGCLGTLLSALMFAAAQNNR